jgi:hypothetical protein
MATLLDLMIVSKPKAHFLNAVFENLTITAVDRTRVCGWLLMEKWNNSGHCAVCCHTT